MRQKYYCVDTDGYLVSVLYLTEAEAAGRSDIVASEPPSRPAPQYNNEQHDLMLVKKVALEMVSAKKATETSSPIMSGGMFIDADLKSVLALNSKLVELSALNSSESLSINESGGVVWRDANNNLNAIPTVEEFIVWAKSAVANISRRNTAVLTAMWSAENAINQATTKESAMELGRSAMEIQFLVDQEIGL